MRLATTQDSRLVAIDGATAVDLTDALGAGATGPGGPLLGVLEAGDATERLAALQLGDLPRMALADVRFGAPIARPGKIVGAPVNYLDHKTEMSEQKTIAEYGVFLKATSSVIGPGESIRLPYTDKRTDQEGELGIVIGRTARNVGADEARDHIFGYVPVLDVTVRSGEDRSTRKSFDTFTPFGPWITTADDVGDPGELDLRCWVDGEERQHSNTRELIFGVAELVSYISHVMTLYPGDLIASGTPAGVGPIEDGQTVALEIERLGRLEVGVTDRGAIPYADRPGAAVANG